LVLANDPKSSAGNIGSNPLAGVFSSATKGQQSIKNITWVLVIVFYVLTVIKY
jgi:preprotein translocase subunit SecG